MKKLMVLVAVSALAIASQAAQFQWKANRNALADYTGLTVYCVNGSDYTLAVAALTAGGTDVATKFNAYVQSSALVAGNGGITALTSYEAESTAAFFVFAGDLIKDGSTYDTTGAMDVSAYLFTPPDSSPVQLALANANFTVTEQPIGQAVPEPTSGLLLLLGVAGMALRRRRA